MLVSELEDFDLVRMDWSGHGRSPTPQTSSIESYVEDCEGPFLVKPYFRRRLICIIAVINHLDLKSLIVVGHSLGGLICLHLAAKLPQKVKSLVLFGPVRSPPEAGQKGLAARAETVRKEGMVAVADTVVSNAFAAESYTKRKVQVALAREMLTRQDPHGYALACEALKNSTLPDWSLIKAKVTILSGEEDKVSTVQAGEATVSDLGDHASQQRLSGVGHWHMLEAPDACIDAIKKSTE